MNTPTMSERVPPEMGEVVATLYIENSSDRDRRPELPRESPEIRHITIQGVVDTGAVSLALPKDAVERLGLRVKSQITARFADGRRETVDVAGTADVHIGNRMTSTNCVVLPVGTDPLIGQVILEELDLIVDCGSRTLGPRPESPDRPLLNLY